MSKHGYNPNLAQSTPNAAVPAQVAPSPTEEPSKDDAEVAHAERVSASRIDYRKEERERGITTLMGALAVGLAMHTSAHAPDVFARICKDRARAILLASEELTEELSSK